jgi:hypothetical protein
MSKIEKLIARFLTMPTDFHYDEVVKLLGHFDFEEVKTGKTSGSRVKFMNQEGVPITLHSIRLTKSIFQGSSTPFIFASKK